MKLKDRPIGTKKRSDDYSFSTQKPELEPRYLRIGQASYVFGISRTRLFALCAAGTIKSRHIVQPGNSRGIRLIEEKSLRDYVESWDSEGRRIKKKEVEA